MLPANKLLVAVSLTLLAMSCSPRHQDAQHNNTNSNTEENASTAENGPGIRRVCADEIQKYCADDQHKRRCLRDNEDKLGDACKQAVNASGNMGNGHGRGIGRICADELQKFCANAPRKFRCLKDNLAQLGDACKAALSAPRNHQQDGGQQTNGGD
jgi:hypothetical protein